VSGKVGITPFRVGKKTRKKGQVGKGGSPGHADKKRGPALKKWQVSKLVQNPKPSTKDGNLGVPPEKKMAQNPWVRDALSG